MNARTSALAMVAVGIMSLTACGNSEKQQQEEAARMEQMRQDSIARVEQEKATADSLAAIAAEQDSIKLDEEAIAFITEFYNKKKYESNSYLRKVCSKDVIRKLKADNEYDDGGLAGWDFRSGAQDGPSNAHRITGVEAKGDHWYTYSFLDMGIKGKHTVQVVKEGDDFKITGLK